MQIVMQMSANVFKLVKQVAIIGLRYLSNKKTEIRARKNLLFHPRIAREYL